MVILSFLKKLDHDNLGWQRKNKGAEIGTLGRVRGRDNRHNSEEMRRRERSPHRDGRASPPANLMRAPVGTQCLETIWHCDTHQLTSIPPGKSP